MKCEKFIFIIKQNDPNAIAFKFDNQLFYIITLHFCNYYACPGNNLILIFGSILSFPGEH